MKVESMYEMLHATLSLASKTIERQMQNSSVYIKVSNTVERQENKPHISIKPVSICTFLCTKPSLSEAAPICLLSQRPLRSSPDNRHFNADVEGDDELELTHVFNTPEVTSSRVARKRKYVPVVRKKELDQTIQRRKSKTSVLFDAEHHDKLHLRSDISQDGLLIRSLDELFKN